jgi:hypothetical protein
MDDVIYMVKTTDGKEHKIKGGYLRKLAFEHNDRGERVLTYDLDYIRAWIRSDMYIFDLRHWPDNKFSAEALKKWYDNDFQSGIWAARTKTEIVLHLLPSDKKTWFSLCHLEDRSLTISSY